MLRAVVEVLGAVCHHSEGPARHSRVRTGGWPRFLCELYLVDAFANGGQGVLQRRNAILQLFKLGEPAGADVLAMGAARCPAPSLTPIAGAVLRDGGVAAGSC